MSRASLFRRFLSRSAHGSARLAVKLNPLLALKSDQIVYPFIEDGLATLQNSDFSADPRFKRAYELGKQTGSWRNHELRWRIHVLLWSASCALKLPGAFVECGVYRGGFARAIIDYTDFGTSGKNYYLFDTFAGFDLDLLNQTERQTVGTHYHYEECYEAVQKEFSEMPFVHPVRGSIPDSLINVGPVAFLSIDMNCVSPEISAAKFYWPCLSPGALILLDDYGFTLHLQQKAAFDALAASWNVKILSLPTGQGIIQKPGPT